MTYKILVVDDEPDLEPLVLQRMRRHIRRGRYEFVFAHNGIEALEELEADPSIDMVVSDINMPRMDGLTLLEQIPNVSPDIRAIIVSAYGDMENIRTAMNRGAFDFVTKPVDFDDLQFTIDRTLEHIEQWREALSTRDKLVALQNELDVASKMQQSILPTVFPSGPTYKIFGTMHPAKDVGGDFFDIVRLADDKVGLAIADVSDKGVPAALFMMSSRTLLKGSAIGTEAPGDVLTEVNNLLNEDETTGMFVTMLYAVYDPATGEFTYASGGHDPPLVVRADGTSELKPLTGGIALGVLGGFEYRQDSFQLEPGDTVCLYTDGVTEATNQQGELMGIEGIQELFASAPPTGAEQSCMGMLNRVLEFTGEAAQHDDITCLTLHRD
ncbi:MAG: SpoIIE family protein phosphatase [Dehalococcoidia bacterium]|nr:SpoIIE family protein phosphatase [Chloroflexota bacterium]MDE2670149.1 SpoIIE family protein phosphatase [Chloroflexota bacterium]MXY36389.1 SpoIIE family protein phosphatase [Dehalococcoidia bacterium]MYK26309.1 SpoIIE family protein phosphatase [Dehalococcoidia bacterium]